MNINKKKFYTLSFTWGIIMTALGCIVSGFMLLTGHRPKKWNWSWFFETRKKHWGGMSWGPAFIHGGTGESEELKNHEFGHAIQNCYYGPLMIPLVCIPSALRFRARKLMTKLGHPPKTDYDDAWFEGQATRLGNLYSKKIKAEAAAARRAAAERESADRKACIAGNDGAAPEKEAENNE